MSYLLQIFEKEINYGRVKMGRFPAGRSSGTECLYRSGRNCLGVKTEEARRSGRARKRIQVRNK